jgi:hypothetical protein
MRCAAAYKPDREALQANRRNGVAVGIQPQDPRLGNLRTLMRPRDRGHHLTEAVVPIGMAPGAVPRDRGHAAISTAGGSAALSMAAIPPRAGMMLHCGK